MSGFLSLFISSPASWPQLWPGYPQSIGPTRCQWWTVSGHVKHSSLSSLSPSHGEHLESAEPLGTEAEVSSLEAGCPTLHPIQDCAIPTEGLFCRHFCELYSIMSSAVRNRPINCQVKEGILFGAFHSFPVPEIMLYMAVLMFPFIPRDFVPCFYFLSWIWGAGAES